MVEWTDTHYIDDEGRRWALAVPWSTDAASCGGIPEILRLTPEERAEAWSVQRVTATVIQPEEGEDYAEDGDTRRYRVYLQGEIRGFGSGHHTITAKVGRKWVRIKNASGKSRRLTLQEFNLLQPEWIP